MNMQEHIESGMKDLLDESCRPQVIGWDMDPDGVFVNYLIWGKEYRTFFSNEELCIKKEVKK